VQFVPPVAEQAGQLYQFQRSANWLMPKPDRVFSDRAKMLFRRLPLWERIVRTEIYLSFELRFLAMRNGSKANQMARDAGLDFLTEQVSDPELRAKLTPDYPVGCKRILITDDYLPALCRDNVEVVTDPIARIQPDGIVTADGTHRPVDTIVVATGFEATDFLSPIDIVGRHGRRLHDEWKAGASAYEGVAVSGYPNLFILYGPNTNLGHNTIIFMIEAQIRFVLACLDRLREPGVEWIDVRPEAAARYDDGLQQALVGTVWEAGCDSWYKTAEGKVTNNWPKFTFQYWWETRHHRVADFELGRALTP
jgi:cation diffusion facilitator CzcD-associated flavoprotein CzcO